MICSFVRRMYITAVTIALFILAIALPASVRAEGTDTGKKTNLSYEQAKERIGSMFNALEHLERNIDKTKFDVGAKAKALGTNVEEIFAFVRDDVRYEPYWGVLRGASGTLMGLAGNSLDQSLLLAALLKAHKFDVRFAIGSLQAGDAKKLLGQAFANKPAINDAEISPQIVTEAAQILGIATQQIDTLIGDGLADAEDMQESLWSDVESDHAFITGMLQSRGLVIGRDKPDVAEATMLEEAGEHVWVQYKNATGDWVDLDPSFRKSNPGEARVQANETFAILPDKFHHTLQFEVTLRTITSTGAPVDDKTEDHSLLDINLRLSDLVGQNVILANVANIQSKRTQSPEQRLAKITEFTPVLLVGDLTPKTGRSFDLSGTVFEFEKSSLAATVNQFAAPLKQTWGALGGVLEKITEKANEGDANIIPPKTNKWIGGLWFSYTLSMPRGAGKDDLKRTFRRNLLKPEKVDAWSARGREAGTTTQQVYRDTDDLKLRLEYNAEVFPLIGGFNQEFLDAARIAVFTRNQTFIRHQLAKIYNKSTKSLGKLPTHTVTYPISTATFAMASTRAATALASIRFPNLRFHRQEPGLVVFERGQGRDDTGRLTAFRGYDIIANPTRVRSSDDNNLASFAVYQGVIDTVVERLLIETLPTTRYGVVTPEATINTRNVFAEAFQNGTELVLLDDDAASLKRLEELAIDESAKADIAAELDNGYLVIVPSRSTAMNGIKQAGWWRIAKDDGNTLGVMQGGKGQALTQKAILQSMIIHAGGWHCLANAQGEWGAAGCAVAAIGGVTGAIWSTEAGLLVQFVFKVLGF